MINHNPNPNHQYKDIQKTLKRYQRLSPLNDHCDHCDNPIFYTVIYRVDDHHPKMVKSCKDIDHLIRMLPPINDDGVKDIRDNINPGNFLPIDGGNYDDPDIPIYYLTTPVINPDKIGGFLYHIGITTTPTNPINDQHPYFYHPSPRFDDFNTPSMISIWLDEAYNYGMYGGGTVTHKTHYGYIGRIYHASGVPLIVDIRLDTPDKIPHVILRSNHPYNDQNPSLT